MITYSGILAWRIPWAEQAGGLQSMGLQKSQTLFSDYKGRSATSCKAVGYNSVDFKM